MQGSRNERVAELVRQELGLMLLRKVKDPALQGITLTEVRVTPDLSVARVYFAARDDDEAEKIRLGLDRANAYFRREIGRKLRLKRPPELRFRRDDVLEQGMQIETILREIGTDEEGS